MIWKSKFLRFFVNFSTSKIFIWGFHLLFLKLQFFNILFSCCDLYADTMRFFCTSISLMKKFLLNANILYLKFFDVYIRGFEIFSSFVAFCLGVFCDIFIFHCSMPSWLSIMTFYNIQQMIGWKAKRDSKLLHTKILLYKFCIGESSNVETNFIHNIFHLW